MIALRPELTAILGVGLWHALVVFLRVSALVSLLPVFGEQAVPVRVRLVVAVMLTAVAAPAVAPAPPPAGLPDLTGYVLSEAVIGLALGVGLRLFVLALQTAGAIAAQSTSLSQLLGGAAVEPMPAMGYVLVVAGLALAAMAGLHVRAAQFLVFSYDLLPAGTLPDGRDLALWGVERVAHAFSLAFSLAAPFVIASVIYNLTLGVINRAMPQLMVAFVGAPVITLGGLFLLFAAAPLMLSVWAGGLAAFMANPVRPIP
ncbi:MAG: flagellar biosynthetic protein FliR [Jhaorihella sp.]